MVFSLTPSVRSPFFLEINDFKLSAKRYVQQNGYPSEVFDCIKRHLEHPCFKQDPKRYMDQWRSARGTTEELRTPNDVSMKFFEYKVIPSLSEPYGNEGSFKEKILSTVARIKNFFSSFFKKVVSSFFVMPYPGCSGSRFKIDCFYLYDNRSMR